MSGDIYLTEIAGSFDLFFKGLTDCGVLSTYSVQLQVSNQNMEMIENIKNLTCQLIKELQIICSKIPSLDPTIPDDVVVLYDPVTFDTIEPTDDAFIISSDVNCDGEIICGNDALESNNSELQTDVSESFSMNLDMHHQNNICPVIDTDVSSHSDTSMKPSNAVHETDVDNIECILIPSLDGTNEHEEFLLDDTFFDKSEESVKDNELIIKQCESNSQNDLLAKMKVDVQDDSSVVKDDSLAASEKLFHIIVDATETSDPLSKGDQIRSGYDCDGQYFLEIKTPISEAKLKTSKPIVKYKWECSICKLLCKTSDELRMHYQVHENTECLSCSFCGKKFLTNYEFRRHAIDFHDDSNHFECDVCGKKFPTKISLTRHMDVHAGRKPAVCNICGKGFRRSDYLLEHRKIHLGEQVFSCKICPKRFLRSAQLKVHEKTHSGVREHVCDVCRKGFTRNDKLKEHVMRHLNIKRFQCNICDKYYAENRDLKLHIKSHY